MLKTLRTKTNRASKNRTHYIKYQLKHDISIRYHFLWENHKSLQGKWIIKDHQTGIKEEISETLAQRMIEDLFKGEPIEIFGKINHINGRYEKRILFDDGHIELIDDLELSKKHKKRISKKLWKKDDGKLSRIISDLLFSLEPSSENNMVVLTVKNANGYEKIKEVILYDNLNKRLMALIKELLSDIKYKEDPFLPEFTRIGKLISN